MMVRRHLGTRLNHRAMVDHLTPIPMTHSSQVAGVTLGAVVQVVIGES